MIDLDAILLRRSDEQCSGSRLPPGGADSWAIRGARAKPGPKGKLSDDQVRQVRRLYAEGVKQQDIADRYGLTRPTVNAIVCGRAYRRVA